MRRTAARMLVLLAVSGQAAALAPAASAQTAAGVPHAWLFGAWTGGLFPVSSGMAAQACLAQPTVIFTRDVVLRAELTDVTYTQRVVATARTNPGVTDFVFAPGVDPAAALGNGLMGMDPPKAASGFGCESADVLHVRRISDTEISFPGCNDFPNPLVRCAAH